MRLGVIQRDVLPHRLHPVGIGRVHLVDDEHVRAAEVHFAGIVCQLVSRAMRIEDNDVEIGTIERRVVVSAVPQDNIALLLRLAQDFLVVHTGVNRGAFHDVRFVFLALFDGAEILVEVGQRPEALRMLHGQVAIGHGMTDHDGIPAELAKLGGNTPRDRALAASGADGADGDDRHFGNQLRAFDAQQPEIGSRGDGARGQVHQRRIGNVAVGKDHHVDEFVVDDLFHLVFFQDGNAIRDRNRPPIARDNGGRRCREFGLR